MSMLDRLRFSKSPEEVGGVKHSEAPPSRGDDTKCSWPVDSMGPNDEAYKPDYNYKDDTFGWL